MWSRCLILPRGLGQCPTHSGWSNKLDEWISQKPGVSQLLMHTWAHPGLSHFSQQPCEVVLAAPSSMGTGQLTGPENTRAEGPCSHTSVQMRFQALPESPFWPKVPLMRSWMSMWVWTIAFVSSCFSGPHFRKLKQQRLPRLSKIIWVAPFGVPLHAWCPSLPLTSKCTQFIETINSPRCLLPSAFTDPVKPILLVESNQRQNTSFISWALDFPQALSSYANLACFLFMAKESKCLKQDKTTHSSQPSSNSIKASEETRTPESSAWHSKAWSNNIEIY